MENVVTYFERTVNNYPRKTALSYREQNISFENLQKEAFKYAAVISKIGKNKPVGVFANRDINAGIWFMGVLYSHNFYVPIDPDMPVKKLQMLFDDAEFEAVLGSEENRLKVHNLTYTGLFITKDDISDEEYWDISAVGSEPAYMVYTSGSTGKPKGVLKSHASILSFINAYCETFDFSEREVIGNQTPFYFDAAAKDFYLMIKTGASIEIIPSELFSMTTQLIEYMNEKMITFASWVPTALSLVAQICPFSLIKPRTLKKMFFIGEVLPMKHLNKWREALPDIEYVNLYGQSELAGVCCYYKVSEMFRNNEVLPMGQPLKNCKVYLVNDNSIITEPGYIGELYIVSEALATEYYHDKERTSQTFLLKDFGEGKVRCFKTGDLAQYNANGDLVFCSRTDYQIKHMGRRIELGEIEVIAGALPEIARCCCLYNEKRRKIVLFCELSEGIQLKGQEIQSKLRPIITNYMLPNKVVVLEKMPLNANRKIDRQKLKTML